MTRPPAHTILNGITRQRIIEIAKENGLRVVERPFTVEEALSAKEAFLTSASSFAKPITRIDDTVIGNGNIGSLSELLADKYLDFVNQPAPA